MAYWDHVIKLQPYVMSAYCMLTNPKDIRAGTTPHACHYSGSARMCVILCIFLRVTQGYLARTCRACGSSG